MDAQQIANKVFWVGKVDDRKVPFHRLILEKGTTYNSYLLKTEKPTMIDTVDIAFGKEYLDNLNKIINPEELEYIVINHVEPDHAGALPALAARAKGAKIVTTGLGAAILKDMFKLASREFLIIKDGDTLDIGGKILKFLETPYLHTEETMITFDMDDKIMFSCDIFSTHIAGHERFNDLAKTDIREDFKTYYKLIMAPHRTYVREMLEKIKSLNIQIIAPSHGYILRENAADFIREYDEMSKAGVGEKPKRVTIIYASMTGNTGKLAERLAKGVRELGVEASVFNLKNADLNAVRESITESDGVLAGSSTKYGDLVENMEDFVRSLKAENQKEKFAAAFGSYGWSGEAIVHLEEALEDAGFTIVNERYLIKKTGMDKPIFPLRVKFVREAGMNLAEEAGRIFGEQVLTR